MWHGYMDSTLLKEKKKMVDYEHIYRWIFFENDNLICNGTLFIMLPHNKEILFGWLSQRERERERERERVIGIVWSYYWCLIIGELLCHSGKYTQTILTKLGHLFENCEHMLSTWRLVRYNLRPNATVLSGTVLKK